MNYVMHHFLENVIRGAGSLMELMPGPGIEDEDLLSRHTLPDAALLRRDWERIRQDFCCALESAASEQEEP